MDELPSSLALIRRAAAMYDADAQLRDAARGAWRGGFASGAQWMALAMNRCRGATTASAPVAPNDFQRLGLIKYALASAAMLMMIGIAVALRSPWPLILAPAAFYFVEVQMLFL